VRELTERYAKEARRHFYVTPTSYLQLLDTFQAVLRRRQAEVHAAQRRYEGGLQKLASTEVQVKAMQRELEGLKPQLIVSGQETAKLMKVIEKETREADKVKLVVQVRRGVPCCLVARPAAVAAWCCAVGLRVGEAVQQHTSFH
jgi:dynein heavy chain, axonemal